MKKFFIALILIVAIIAAVMAGGYYAYKYGERETLAKAEENFLARVESFERERGVECFNVRSVFDERIVGWYFFRIEDRLYIACEYIGFEGVEKVLRAEVINLGHWFDELKGGERFEGLSENNSCTMSYFAPDGSEAAKLVLKISDEGISVTNGFTGETYTADSDFDDYIPPVELSVLSPEEPLEVMRKNLIYHLKGNPYTGGEVTLTYSGSTVSVDEWAEWLEDSFVVPAEDGFYVLCTLCYSSDWRETALVRWTENGGLKLIGCYVGGISTPDWINEDENTVKLESRISVFGTYSYYRTYEISEKGLVPLSDIYDFENNPRPDYWDEVNAGEYSEESLETMHKMTDSRGRRKLTLMKDTVCYNEQGEQRDILAGTVIAPTGINPETQRFYFDRNGRTFYFIYAIDEETWTYSAGGISENKLFEAVYYAG